MVTKQKYKEWQGEQPTKCDMCGRELKKEFIDGRTNMGSWAFMCIMCHHDHGVGLGIGRGQKYKLKKEG